MSDKASSRKNARVPCGAPAQAEGPKGPVRGFCKTLSQAGMYFTGPVLPVGQSVELSVDLPQLGSVKAVGEVRYHHRSASGTGMGIRFTRLAQEDLERVQRFIDRAQSAP